MVFGWRVSVEGEVGDKGNVGMKRESFEGIPSGMRDDMMTCWGTPYMLNNDKLSPIFLLADTFPCFPSVAAS
jgi:hypothetical protein